MEPKKLNITTCQMDVCIQQNNINIQIESPEIISPVNNSFTRLIASFDSISLAEMDTVKLMNRIDTKYIINRSLLPELLKKALSNYRIVEIGGKRIIPYSTIYFDTDNTEMYLMHHNGKLNRYKIRMRSYIDSGISFLEIKTKNNKGRTTKNRIGITNEQFESMSLEEKEQLFLKEMDFQSSGLVPQIQNAFKRITLVDKDLTERVTLDMRLSFQNIPNGQSEDVEDLVIIEMKQDGAVRSHFRDYLNELRINSVSMSKYCLGMMLVKPDLKSNGFKNKLRKITKITNTHYDSI
ncbi:MAG: polyphosphate polymerase domain-containing protein [Paludibacter sp.]